MFGICLVMPAAWKKKDFLRESDSEAGTELPCIVDRRALFGFE